MFFSVGSASKVLNLSVTMDELKLIIGYSFYTQLIMLFTALIALVIGVIRIKRLSNLKLIILYPLATIVQGTLAYLSWIFNINRDIMPIDLISESIFLLFESLILYIFFHRLIVFPSIKKFVQGTFVFFLCSLAAIWAFTNAFFWAPNKIYLLESVFILSLCCSYIWQEIKGSGKMVLLANANFWITVGCLFYFGCTIPLFFFNSIAEENHFNLFSINFIAYSILFGCIAKAFLCDSVGEMKNEPKCTIEPNRQSQFSSIS